MTREEILKERIKDIYGSVLSFSNTTGIPESTIRNIFTRGMDSVSSGTLVEICKYLNLDLECLMEGVFSLRPNPQIEGALIDYKERHKAQKPDSNTATGTSELDRKLIELLSLATDDTKRAMVVLLQQHQKDE